MYNKIQSDIKSAMIEKNNIKRDCLRSVISEIKNQTVNAGKELTNEICIKVLNKIVKQHKDSIDQFTKAGRNDLVERETTELKYLEVYLPKMISDENEIKNHIDNILKTFSIEPIKKNMGQIMKLLGQEIDKKLASKILSSLLK